MKKVLGLFSLLLAMSVHSATYESRFTDKTGKSYFEDSNVWVYTSEFAKRFGMRGKWVDDSLKGAYAVAFRVEIFDAKLKLPHKGEDAGIPNRYCILDVYLPADAEIPWVTNKDQGSVDIPPKSTAYLTVQTEQDKAYKNSSVGLGEPLRSNVSLRTVSGYQRGLSVISYNKSLYPGLSFISFGMGCMTPMVETSYLEFLGPWKRNESPVVHYRAEIPKQFKERLYTNWESRSHQQSVEEYSNVLKK